MTSDISGECDATKQYLRQLDESLLYDFPASTGPAAFLAESIQGVGGTVQFPQDFLRKAFESVKSRGGVCISDEVG